MPLGNETKEKTTAAKGDKPVGAAPPVAKKTTGIVPPGALNTKDGVQNAGDAQKAYDKEAYEALEGLLEDEKASSKKADDELSDALEVLEEEKQNLATSKARVTELEEQISLAQDKHASAELAADASNEALAASKARVMELEEEVQTLKNTDAQTRIKELEDALQERDSVPSDAATSKRIAGLESQLATAKVEAKRQRKLRVDAANKAESYAWRV